jgi:hypothetical protein
VEPGDPELTGGVYLGEPGSKLEYGGMSSVMIRSYEDCHLAGCRALHQGRTEPRPAASESFWIDREPCSNFVAVRRQMVEQ